MKTRQALNTIFSFKISNDEDAQKLHICFSDYIGNRTMDNNFVFNISSQPEELLELTNKVMNTIILSSISIFNIYLYYPTSGFTVFNIKNETIEDINKEDYELFKNQLKQYG